MEPSQADNKESKTRNDHEERVSKIDSDIKRQKEQLLKEFEDSPDDSRKRRPKHSQSATNRLEISQIETPILPFAPFVAKTLQLNTGICFDAVSYNEEHNMIIVCPHDKSVQFYNATTLLPLEGFETEKISSLAFRIAYCPQRKTYLLGCSDGNIYAYNLSSKVLQKVQEQGPEPVITITFLDSKYYGFATMRSHHFSIGNFENEDLLHFNLEMQNSCYLYSLKKGSFLLSSQVSGPLHIYRTDQPPRFPIISTVRGYDSSESFVLARIQSIIFKAKEYILTTGFKGTVKIWHFSKGKMKPLKTFHTGEHILDLVYLDNYKILATTHGTQKIKFFQFPSGRLESTLDLNMQHCQGIFLMKDKNCIGVSSFNENKIKIVELSP